MVWIFELAGFSKHDPFRTTLLDYTKLAAAEIHVTLPRAALHAAVRKTIVIITREFIMEPESTVILIVYASMDDAKHC